MIEAVIWDFGGVFTTSPFEAFARYERERGIPVGTIRKINSTNHENNAWALFERSDIDIHGFDKAFAEEALALGHDIPGKDVLPLLSGDFRPEMIEALRRVKTKFKTGCITNNMPTNTVAGPSEPAAGRSIYAREIMELFDALIESSKIGIRKPDPRIYLACCEALGVEPHEAVFVGDGANDELDGARRVGMEAILIHRSGEGPLWPELHDWDGPRITSIPEVLELTRA